MKRNLAIILVVTLLVIGGVVAYFLLRPTGPGERTFLDNLPVVGGRSPLGGAPPPPGSLGGTAAGGEQPEARLREIIARDILAPAIGVDKKSIYFVDRSSGHILQSDLDGNGETTLANLTILEAFDGSWSPLKNRIAISYAENNTVKRFVESTATGTPSYFLPSNAISASWSPDGRSIAYLVRQGESTNLVIADQANRGGRAVHSTPVPDFTVSWASRNIILFVSRPSGMAPSLVMQFDVASRRIEPILAGSRGVITIPAPDGSGFLYSQSSASGAAESIALYRFADKTITQLGHTTIAEKCAFSADAKRLFCGVPRTIASPSPDEWYRGAASLADDIVEIDPKTGQARSLAAGANIDVMSPFAAPDGSFLFFQNKKTGALWRLTL